MTQLFIKRNTLNLVKNPNFHFVDRNLWNESLEDVDGNYFRCDPSNINHLQFNKVGSSSTNTLSITQKQVGLLANSEYTCTISLASWTRPNIGSDGFYINVTVGGVTSSNFTSLGDHTFNITTANIDEVTITAHAATYDVNVVVGYIRLFKTETQYELDLYKDLPLQITYQTSDVRDFGARKGSFTQTIQLPPTTNNKEIFGNIDIVEVRSKFQVTKKTEVFIMQDGLLIFEGNLQFMNAKKVGEDVTEYEIKLSSNVQDIRDDWGDSTLAVLDMSELNHIYSLDNIQLALDLQYKLNGVDTSYVTLGSTKNFIDTFYNSSTAANAVGLLGLTYAAPHGYERWDTISLSLTNPVPNPQYEQWWTIVEVIDAYNIVLNKGFGASTVGESGTTNLISCNGEGYTYGRIHRGDISSGIFPEFYEVEAFKPNLSLYYVVSKMFNQFGYTFVSDTLNSAFIKNIFLENDFSGLKLDKKEYELKIFKASQTTTDSHTFFTPAAQYHTFTPVEIDNDSTSGNFDVGGNFDVSTFKFKPVKNGNYTLTLEGDVRATGKAFELDGTTLAPFGIGLLWDGIDPDNSTKPVNFGARVSLKAYNTITTVTTEIGFQDFLSDDFLNENQIYPAGENTLLEKAFGVSCNASLTTNDEVYAEVYVWWESNGVGLTDSKCLIVNIGGIGLLSNTPATLKTYLSNYTIFNDVSSDITEGDEINFNLILNKDIKLIDFFDSVCKQFNLQFQLEGSKKYRIESYDTWYSQGDILDWSQKVDMSSTTVTPTAAFQPQRFIFKQTAGADYWNNQTTANIIKDKEGNERQYGQYEILTDNQWNKDSKEISTIFSPTVITNRKGDTSNNGYYIDDVTLPRIIAELDKKDIPDEGIRLLYFNLSYNDEYRIYSKTNQTYTPNNLYCSLSHVNDNSIPTIDLNWSSPAIAWFTVDRWTDNNVYNKFYYNHIQDLLDIDSKMIAAKVYLDSVDINNLDMRDIIVFNRNRYRLNKITYSTVLPTMADVELISF